jgi:hypothetical protein
MKDDVSARFGRLLVPAKHKGRAVGCISARVESNKGWGLSVVTLSPKRDAQERYEKKQSVTAQVGDGLEGLWRVGRKCNWGLCIPRPRCFRVGPG